MIKPELISQLADRARSVLGDKHRIVITLVGSPGSGKTSIAEQVVAKLNKDGIETALVSMDGHHYPMKLLIEKIGEEKARKFRGAPYTFDAQGVVDLMKDLKKGSADVSYPTFDHKIKDPVANGATAPATARIIIFEGNYLQLRDEPWNQINALADDTWAVKVDPKIVRVRIAKRHLASGIVNTLEDGLAQADQNDIPNGIYVNEHSFPAALTVTN